MKECAAFTLPVVGEWLHGHPDESLRNMLLELPGAPVRPHHDVILQAVCHEGFASAVGTGVHANAIMERIVHNATWVDTVSQDMGN
ncbi:ATP-binding protein [Arthrobacter rhombi]|uniref:ATP-binding protein n=1 Tax=Arthrobacter rhombi TaxID=71253 RepID=UPI003F8E599E